MMIVAADTATRSRLPAKGAPKPAPVNVSPPAPRKQEKEFPPSVKKVKGLDVHDGIIGCLRKAITVNSAMFEEDLVSGSHRGET
jgi:hypothetical protein